LRVSKTWRGDERVWVDIGVTEVAARATVIGGRGRRDAFLGQRGATEGRDEKGGGDGVRDTRENSGELGLTHDHIRIANFLVDLAA
jgi:hypothetical protein